MSNKIKNLNKNLESTEVEYGNYDFKPKYIKPLPNQEKPDKVYVVYWVNSFDDWKIKIVCSKEEKAKEYVDKLGEHNHYYTEVDFD